jgi:hypothetical protein
MQLKTSYAAQVTAMRKERDMAQKERGEALGELANKKAHLAAATCEIDLLKEKQAHHGARGSKCQIRTHGSIYL